LGLVFGFTDCSKRMLDVEKRPQEEREVKGGRKGGNIRLTQKEKK